MASLPPRDSTLCCPVSSRAKSKPDPRSGHRLKNPYIRPCHKTIMAGTLTRREQMDPNLYTFRICMKLKQPRANGEKYHFQTPQLSVALLTRILKGSIDTCTYHAWRIGTCRRRLDITGTGAVATLSSTHPAPTSMAPDETPTPKQNNDVIVL
jgi:hypothetical protein